MISIPVPLTIDYIIQVIQEALRRAVDGTVVPLFVDYNNQRVLVGSTQASASPAKMEITGNLKIITQGTGVIIQASNSSNYYLIGIQEITNDDGTISPVFTATKQ